MSPVSLRIRELRQARGWSLRELGRRAGIRHATLSRIEAGHTTGIDFSVLERLADVLEVDAGYLIVHERKARSGRADAGKKPRRTSPPVDE